jgi:hypothetical protein
MKTNKIKMFPCTKGKEALSLRWEKKTGVVTCCISFWSSHPKYFCPKMAWGLRLKFILNVLLGKPFPVPMLEMDKSTVRNMANHILYKLSVFSSKKSVVNKTLFEREN